MFGLKDLRGEAAEKLSALDRSQALAEFSPDGTILFANENFLRSFGYQLSEVVGRKHAMLVEPKVAAASAYKTFWSDLAAGVFHRAEFKRLAKGGREVWIQATYNPLKDRKGKVVKILKLATDVTDAVARSMDCSGQLQALHHSQAIVEFDLAGNVISANPNFLSVFGYDLDEIQGKHHRLFVNESYASSAEYALFWERLQTGRFQAGEYCRRAKDGRDVFIQATYNPITDRDGRPTKIVKFAVDVTQKVRAQEGLGRDLSAIAEATRQVAEQAASAASQAGSVLGEMSVVVEGADEMIRSAGHVADQAATAISMSSRAVLEAKKTATIMGALGGNMSRIDQILSMIQGIATQTNLLSLNATIEAARAGTSGQGFAIVAQEVKALAMQTAHATCQIGDLLRAVQNGAGEVTAAIGEIEATIFALDDLSNKVAEAARLQTIVTAEISHGVHTASGSATAITESMSSIASSTDILDKNTQKARAAAQALA